MTVRQIAIVVVAVLAVGACKKKTPPEAAPTPGSTVSTDDAAARARADSIAAYEAAREAEARERAAAMASVREALTAMVHFEFDSESLSSEAQERLRAKAAILRANPNLELQIAGHADERGSTEYNLALGQRRAESVRRFLVGYGIDPSRLTTISYGKERPLVEGSTESAWARNRRAEFVVTAGDISNLPAEEQ